MGFFDSYLSPGLMALCKSVTELQVAPTDEDHLLSETGALALWGCSLSDSSTRRKPQLDRGPLWYRKKPYHGALQPDSPREAILRSLWEAPSPIRVSQTTLLAP